MIGIAWNLRSAWRSAFSSSVFVDAHEVNDAGLNRELSPNQREPARQHVRVRHLHIFLHLFRFDPIGDGELASGA